MSDDDAIEDFLPENDPMLLESRAKYLLPNRALRFESIGHLQAAVSESGSFYFHPNNMKAFEVELSELYAGCLFVQSKVGAPNYNRRHHQVSWVAQPPGPRKIEVVSLKPVGEVERARAQAVVLSTLILE